MKRNYLFDVDGLLQVLQAIKEGRPVEYRPLEEPNWRDFNPEEYDIDTENYLYRVKPCEYSEYVGGIAIPPALMQEDVIYFLKNKDPRSTKQSFACVKVNFWQTDKKIWLHFFWSEDGDSKKLYVSDPDRRVSRSEKTDNFANEIIPDINLANPDKAGIYVASISQVKMLESRLRDVGYELKDGQMKRIDGNKA